MPCNQPSKCSVSTSTPPTASKTRKTPAPPLPVIPKRNDRLPVHLYSAFCEIFSLLELSSCQTLAEQCYLFHGEAMNLKTCGEDWEVTQVKEGLFFGVTGQNFRKMMVSYKEVLQRGTVRGVGRPPNLDNSQVDQILQYVAVSDQEKAPLTQSNLLLWVNSTFSTHLSLTWLQKFIAIQRDLGTLFVVDSVPLEKERGDVKADLLQKNAEELQRKIELCHPHLILNMDETGIDCKLDTKKILVVSRKNNPRPYQTSRGESHITLVPTIGINGWKLPILAIIKTKTFDSVLQERYGLPVNEWAHVTTSTSAYINQELFLYWIEKILVPGIAARRLVCGLKKDAKALLIIDGCLSHSEEALKKLSEHSIDYHFLVPHSSHLTQPLDRGIFSSMKARFKTVQCPTIENKLARRLMKGLIALDEKTSSAAIIGAFVHAGIVLSYSEGKPSVRVAVRTWLTQQTSPQTEIKEDHYASLQKSTSNSSRKRTRTAAQGLTQKEITQKQPCPKKSKTTATDPEIGAKQLAQAIQQTLPNLPPTFQTPNPISC